MEYIISCNGDKLFDGSRPKINSPVRAVAMAIRSSDGNDLIVSITWGVIKIASFIIE